jgi:hypothetical protein
MAPPPPETTATRSTRENTSRSVILILLEPSNRLSSIPSGRDEVKQSTGSVAFLEVLSGLGGPGQPGPELKQRLL